jgi:hypothetical protein
MDALLTPRQVAQPLGAKGGDYGMSVPAQQPPLQAAMEWVWP